jgi:creatinine amidohydrolase
MTETEPVSETESDPQACRASILEKLTWKEAEAALTKSAVVVIPLGAQAKEHGLHLRLGNDFLMAEYLKREVAKRLPVVIAPTINYSYYPAFTEYAGSISLSLETARAMFVEIVRSLAAFGPRHFYFLNTGISTVRPLEAAARELEQEGVNVSYMDLRIVLQSARVQLEEQPGGSHADEIETSIMLVAAPETVDMAKAACDFHGDAAGPLSPEHRQGAIYSPTGAWGDPTKASLEKGRVLVTALIDGIVFDITRLLDAAGGHEKPNS